MENESDELDALLLLATSEDAFDVPTESAKPPENVSAPINVSKPNGASEKVSLVDEGMDSSDEEDIQNFLERKYNEYGRDINSVLKNQNEERLDSFIDREVSRSIGQRQQTALVKKAVPTIEPAPKPLYQPKPIENINIYSDPVFGLRIVQPLISSSLLLERMVGRTAVDIRNLDHHITASDLSQDWCMGGVVVSKSPVQTSQKGAQYIIWKISDLKGDIKMVSVFLFKNAYKELWKTSQGTAVAILNPNVLPRKDGKSGDLSLSIDSAQKVMILGRSKDLGVCKSKKKNGEPCTAVVNVHTCEYCIYHVKQEYGKMTGRSELQSATSGRGLQSLRNKVLGKNEVFYGGKSFVSEPAMKNKKLALKDQKRLMSLSDNFQSSPLAAAISYRPQGLASYGTNRPVSRIAESVESSVSQRKRDLDRLNRLKDSTTTSTNTTLTSTNNNSSPAAFSSNLTGSLRLNVSNPTTGLNKTPILSRESFSFTVNKNDAAKAKALQIIQKIPIEKSNPNLVKYRGTENGKKRLLEIMASGDEENALKKRKLEQEVEAFKNERIQKILHATSSHQDLVKARENREQDKYFDKLEKKEIMEEKMVNTLQVDCKAVICKICKYKAFSAADRCKAERHPLKVVDAEKRFFQCEDCGNRVVSLFRIPKTTCSNCQSSKWKRTGMIREKNLTNVGEQLSIRGDEETFIGSLQSNGNLNLCVSAE